MRALLGSFDSIQIAVLQNTWDLACKELGVPAADEKGRSCVAKAVFTLAKAKQFDPERLKVYALSRFKALEAEALV